MIFWRVILGWLMLSVSGCVTELSSLANPDQVSEGLLVGRVVTVQMGAGSRRPAPQMQFLELEHQDSSKRFQVELQSPDQRIVVPIPPGRYRLTRVQIGEGPFRSMAELDMVFSVDVRAISYVGTWKFEVESPRYGRHMVVSMAAEESQMRIQDFLIQQYPQIGERTIVETIPQPSHMDTRLFEVMPYPRYPRYFRRHWW